MASQVRHGALGLGNLVMSIHGTTVAGSDMRDRIIHAHVLDTTGVHKQ